MALALLIGAQLLGLLLLPFGLPGLWVQLGGLVLYAWLTGFASVGMAPLVAVFVLASVAELLEFWLGARFTRRYGGGRHAGWGAMAGGVAGALVGVPVPLIGSVIGAFVGAFAGAVLLELLARRQMAPALRAGWGALLGRVIATATKVGFGVVVAAVALFAALG
ncbi:MAG: DUF456 domain-containing protein [Gemmatimonadota bacterium]|nr:DUF456 domain-containing protein [Gemmatimonadota bacterium]